MEFSRQEYWCGLPFASLWNLPDPGMEPWPPALQADFFFFPLFLLVGGLLLYNCRLFTICATREAQPGIICPKHFTRFLLAFPSHSSSQAIKKMNGLILSCMSSLQRALQRDAACWWKGKSLLQQGAGTQRDPEDVRHHHCCGEYMCSAKFAWQLIFFLSFFLNWFYW